MIELLLAIYLTGFICILFAMGLLLREEPTAHGQIEGRKFGLVVAIFWPLVLLYLAMLPLLFVGTVVWHLARRRP